MLLHQYAHASAITSQYRFRHATGLTTCWADYLSFYYPTTGQMVRAQEFSSDASGSAEMPFEPMVFPANAQPIPIGPPDTASLTAMPEAYLPTVIPTDSDWRDHPRWKPLIGTPSRTPIPSGTLVPDPSPARSCSDAASDVLIPPSPAGSFVHRRRRGEYAQRPPVWSIQALVEDTKGWHEMGKSSYNYESPWSGRVVSNKVSYDNQLEKMATVMTREPLIVRMALNDIPANTSAPGNDTFLSKITTPGGTVEEPPYTDRVLSRTVLPLTSELVVNRVRQDQPILNAGGGFRHPSATAFITQMVKPWLSNIPPTPNEMEYQNSEKRALLGSYTDARSEAGIQIMPGALVVCIGATSNFTSVEDHTDQFKMVFGGLYRVLQIFGDTWAFCRKLSGLSTKEMVESSLMPDSTDVEWARQKLFGAKKELCFMLIEPTATLNFLPLCAVTLLENFEDYCQGAKIGPGLSQPRIPSGGPDTAVAAPNAPKSRPRRAASLAQIKGDHRRSHEGGVVMAAPRFSSLDKTFTDYRRPDGVLVPLWVYKDYLKPIMTKRPQRIWRDRETVMAAFEERQDAEKHLPTPDDPAAAMAPRPSVSTLNGRFDTVSLRTVDPADSASNPAAAATAVRPVQVLVNGTPRRIEDTAMTPPRSEQDSLSGATARELRLGTWTRIKFATQRLGTQGRQRARDYFAPPAWVRKSPHRVRSLF